MSSIKISKFHQSVGGHHVVNTGRMTAGEHKENIVATSDKMPKRGDTGPGGKKK